MPLRPFKGCTPERGALTLSLLVEEFVDEILVPDSDGESSVGRLCGFCVFGSERLETPVALTLDAATGRLRFSTHAPVIFARRALALTTSAALRDSTGSESTLYKLPLPVCAASTE